MSRAAESWPDPIKLSVLAEAAVRAYEELWLAWVPALAVEALFHEEVPNSSVAPSPPSAAAAALHPQPTAFRKTLILLADEVFDPPQLISATPTSWPLRSAVVTPARALEQFSKGLASRPDQLGKRWIQPLHGKSALRPEAVVVAFPIRCLLLVSVGSQLTCTLIAPDSWTPASAPLAVPRGTALPLSSLLSPPPAQAWAKTWDLRKAELGIRTVLTSPFQSTADGPCLPIRLPSHEQGRLKHPWLLAVDGPCGALARVTQFP